jgi:hypothetical protein
MTCFDKGEGDAKEAEMPKLVVTRHEYLIRGPLLDASVDVPTTNRNTEKLKTLSFEHRIELAVGAHKRLSRHYHSVSREIQVALGSLVNVLSLSEAGWTRRMYVGSYTGMLPQCPHSFCRRNPESR